jgi:glyoxylase I family protein
MEKVAGIGGLFFRAHDPKALGLWYQQHLGISLTPSKEDNRVWEQEAGPTSFTPFPNTTKYFGDPQKMWMVNFRVHDLDKMVAQLRTAGIEVKDLCAWQERRRLCASASALRSFRQNNPDWKRSWNPRATD